MNIEERAKKAEEFLNGLKEQVFIDNRFSLIYTDLGTLKDEIENIIVDLKTKSRMYLMAKERNKKYSINPFYQGQYEGATRDLESVLLSYEELCISKILPTLKQKLIELPDKLNEGKIKLDTVASLEHTIEEPPPEIKMKPSVIVPVDPLGDKRVNTFKEKINRALEWIEIPLKIGRGVEKFLSEHGSTIVSAASGVLKMLTIL